MNAVQHTVTDTAGHHCVIHVLMPEDRAGLTPKDSDEVMEQIRLRATVVGPVLESILHDPHADSHAEYDE